MKELPLLQKLFISALLCLLFSSFSTPLSAQFAGGDGSPGDPYIIETAQQLDQVRNFLDDAFMLNADIDLTDNGFADGEGWDPIGECDWDGTECIGAAFSGEFDGNGFEISNLTINQSGSTELGLFGFNDGTLENVTLVNAAISAEGMSGSLAAVNNGTIDNSSSQGLFINGGTDYNFTPATDIGLGGLVGTNLPDGEIIGSYTTGEISPESGVAGGLVSVNNGTITDSYSIVDIEVVDFGPSALSGLVVFNNSTIETSYAAGNIGIASIRGGLVGEPAMIGAEVTDSYWDEDATGIESQPFWPPEQFGYGLTGVQMRLQPFFNGFDFSDNWQMEEGVEVSYPFLQDNPQSPAPGLGTLFAGGDGSEADPLQVSSAQQLDAVRFYSGSDYDHLYFEQTADINLEDILLDNSGNLIGDGWIPIGNEIVPFMGHFDGGEFIIENLIIDDRFGSEFGLFGAVDSGTLTNIALEDVTIQGSEVVGALTARNAGASISQSYAFGVINASGGNAGGLVGINDGGSVIDSYSLVAVIGEGSNSGGLIGVNNAIVETSYSAGGVAGDASDIGGLIGTNSGTVTDSYWNTDTSTQNDSDGGFGLSNNEMREQSNFSGFEFTSDWDIDEGASYPFLTTNTQQPLPGFNPFDGEGTEADPYLVSNAALLDAVRLFTGAEHSDVYFEQTEDIDLSDFLDDDGDLINNGEGWTPIGKEGEPFYATFDGNGYKIFNLAIEIDGFGYRDDNGLFGVNEGTLLRIGIEDAAFVVDDNNNNGLLAGTNGLNGTIRYSYAAGMIENNNNNNGGLVGTNEGLIENAYAYVDISGFGLTGGFVGQNANTGTINNAYANGPVSGSVSSSTGAFVGSNNGSLNGVYYRLAAGGFGDGQSLTESQYRQQSSYVGFDFDTIWDIKDEDNLSAPFLRENIQDPAPAEIPNDFAAGDGSVQKPFQIANAEQLDELRNYLGDHFELISNIDLSAPQFSDGEGWAPIGECNYNELNELCESSATFHGSLDGNNFEIQNLTINREEDQIGLFAGLGYISNEGASIRNLTFTNALIEGEDYTGILAGALGGNEPVGIINVNIQNSVVTGRSFTGGIAGVATGATNTARDVSTDNLTVTADNVVGGIFGRFNSNGFIRDSEISGLTINTREETAFASQQVGGIVGSGQNLTILNTTVTAFLTAADGDITNSRIGGIAGMLTDGSSISESSAFVEIIAENNQVGGLVGYLEDSIINTSFAVIEDLDASGLNLGGLVGRVESNSEINTSYSIHNILFAGGTRGGLVGLLSSDSSIDESYTSSSRLVGVNDAPSPYNNVTNSYWNTVGTSSSQGGTELDELQLRQQANFAGFDFSGTWDIGATGLLSHPYLQGNPQDRIPGELANPFAAGDGHPDTPFEITTAEELAAIDGFYTYENAYFEQTTDIDLSSISPWETIGSSTISKFRGDFDGGGYEITGLLLNVAEEDGAGTSSCTGLFCSNEGKISDVRIIEATANLTEVVNTGFLVGANIGGDISNVDVSGTINLFVGDGFTTGVRNERIGAVVGINDDEAIISGAHTSVTIIGTAARHVGGIAGQNFDSIIESSSAIGLIRGLSSDTAGETDGIIEAGGIAGQNRTNGVITESFASVNIRGNSGLIGGLVGLNSSGGAISKSFATGRLDAVDKIALGGSIAGGLVGKHEGFGSIIEDSYALGTVSGEPESADNTICDGPCVDIGGLIGWMVPTNATVERSYSAGRVITRGTAIESFGGLIGRIGGGGLDAIVEDSYWNIETSGLTVSADGEGLTTADMLEADGFGGFSFNPVWAIEEGESFAYLVDNTQSPLPGPPPEVDIEGDAGWRLMSMPVNNVSIRDLALQNMVQGIPGANEFYEAEYGDIEFESEVPPNIYYFEPSNYDPEDDAQTGWVAPDDMDFEFESGHGFIWYMWDNDTGPSVPLDEFTLMINGTPPLADVTVSFNSSDEWILTGNPFDSNIDASELSGGGLQSAAAQIWDTNLGDEGSYRVVNFTEGNTIAAWQGFWIENESAAEFVIPETARTDDDATFYNFDGEQEKPLLIDFKLEGTNESFDINTIDAAIGIMFNEFGSLDWDEFDIRKLTPLSGRYAMLSFNGVRDGEPIEKAQVSLPTDLAETVEIPSTLHLSNMGGEFSLSWDIPESIPEHIEIQLVDLESGDEIDLRSAGSYEFTANEDVEISSESAGKLNLAQERTNSDGYVEKERFVFVISSTATSTGPETELPEEIALDQNYPNPFNPVTTIRYALPESDNVRIDVYNVMGQRVATLVNDHQSAGYHTVTFDGTALASGVYLYRLQAGSTEIVQKMTLVK